MSVPQTNPLESIFFYLITGLREKKKRNVLIPYLKSLGLQALSNPGTQIISIRLSLSWLCFSLYWLHILSRLLPRGDKMTVSSSRIMSYFAKNSSGRACLFPNSSNQNIKLSFIDSGWCALDHILSLGAVLVPVSPKPHGLGMRKIRLLLEREGVNTAVHYITFSNI